MNTHDVTVVVPTRDRPAFRAATIGSICAQTGGAPRIVVVDDASRVPVPAIEGVTVVRTDVPVGAAGARNRGLAEVSTEFVAFCDDDDLWAPDKIASQCAALASRPAAVWSYTAAVEVDENLSVLGAQRALDSGWIERRLLDGNVVAGGGSTVLARTDCVRAAGAFAADLGVAEDWDLWSRLAHLGEVVAVDRPLVAWRRHSGNKSGRWSPEALNRLDVRFRQRAAVLGVAYEHRYAAQAAIDRAVQTGARAAAARGYAARFRASRSPRDLLAMAYVAAAPQLFARTKASHHLRSVPSTWTADLAWLAGVVRRPDLDVVGPSFRLDGR